MMYPVAGLPRFTVTRALIAMAAIVCAGSGLLAYQAVSAGLPTAQVAGTAKMELLRDEHALVAAYVAGDTQARKRANAAADDDAARLRLAAQGEAQRQAHLAAAEQARQANTAEMKIAMHAPERSISERSSAPLRVAARDTVTAEPLALAQPAVVTPAPTKAADGPVRSRLRELASDVKRIPSLLQSAVGWVVDTVPAPKLPSLPGLPIRQFSAAI